jgi:predicted RNA-binding protein with PUA-like domain
MAHQQYWLFKSEPECYSFQDLMKEPSGRSPWEGVRNYTARNFMRDIMQVGDGILFYHSSCEVPGVVGVAEVASEAYPDPTQFDPSSEYFDPKSSQETPRWFLVDVKPVAPLRRLVSLAELKQTAGLEAMQVTKRGNRLSITPVTVSEWKIVLALGKLNLD